MLKNHFKSAFRNLIKYKVGSTINVAGLTVALLTTFVIYSWVKHELSYDSMHEDSDQVYRLVIDQDDEQLISLSPAIKTRLLDNIPEIENSVRLFKASVVGGKTKVAHENKVFTNNEIVYTDENFFSIFSFPLVYGDKNEILKKPNAVVLTEETAEKYFGSEDPVGKTLMVSNKNLLEVTGVVESLPSNSHFHFDMLVSMKSHPWGNIDRTGLGSGYVYYNYIKIYKDSSPASIIEKINEQLAGIELSWDWDPMFGLQPIKDIHLHSDGWGEFEANGSMTFVYVFVSIGFLVLLIAAINYINMAAAYSLKRSKEIGIRKTIGAERKQLIVGFLVESLVVVLTAFVLALFINELVKPAVHYITGTSINIWNNEYWIAQVFLCTLVLGVIIGFFPALFLTRVSPSSLITSKFTKTGTRFDFKNLLLTIQFCISIFLIIGTIVVYNQMQYMQNKKLGYDKEQVFVLHTGYENLKNKTELLKQTLVGDSKIVNASLLSQIPSNISTGEGVNLPDGNRIEVSFMSVDKDFFRTLSVDIIEGKERIGQVKIDPDISEENRKNQFVVNRSFLSKMEVNAEDAINKNIVIRHGNMQPGPIIGVIDDFHFQSLHNPIGPLVLEFTPHNFQHLLVKLNTDDIKATMGFIENTWKNIAGDLPFDYQFLDETYNALYKEETKVSYLILTLSIISIVIGSIGLFGLSLFFVERKTKEIGIRKVMGASVLKIFTILTKSFTKWVLIANIITWPIGYYIMSRWLENFAYKTTLSWWIFALAGAIAMAIALVTVSWQSFRAAIANPVESLRNE